MSVARACMTMLADVEWVSNSSTTDDFGLPAEPSWETTASDVPCYAWSETKRDIQDGGKHVIQEDLKAMIPRGQPIQDEWRLTSVTDRLGVEIFDGPLLIESITVREDHLLLMLRKVDSGANKDL